MEENRKEYWDNVYNESGITHSWLNYISGEISKQICNKRGLYHQYYSDIKQEVMLKMYIILDRINKGEIEPKNEMNYLFMSGLHHGEHTIEKIHYRQVDTLRHKETFLVDLIEDTNKDTESEDGLDIVKEIYENKELFDKKELEWLELNEKGYTQEEYCKHTGLSRSMYWKKKNRIYEKIREQYEARS